MQLLGEGASFNIGERDERGVATAVTNIEEDYRGCRDMALSHSARRGTACRLAHQSACTCAACGD